MRAWKDGTTLYLVFDERMDSRTALEAEKMVRDVFTPDIQNVEIDCGGMEYIASSGLKLLMTLYKNVGSTGKVTLKNVRDYVTEILEMTGFSDILGMDPQ